MQPASMTIPPSRLLIISLFVFTLFSCGDSQPTAVLELYVLDNFGNRIDSAEVSIYETFEDWQDEVKPAKPMRTTDATGLVRFVGLRAGTYFINAIKNDFNNWEGRIATNVESIGSFYVNTEFAVITDNRSGRLAKAGGKAWKVKRITLNNVEVNILEPCELDNRTIFLKGGALLIDTGTLKCSPDEPQTQEGQWEFSATGTNLLLSLPNNIRESWTLVELSNTELTVQRSFGNLIFSIVYEAVN